MSDIVNQDKRPAEAGPVQRLVIREVGIPPEVIARQSQLLAACAKTFGLDDPITKEYAASVAHHNAICSRIEMVVDNAGGEVRSQGSRPSPPPCSASPVAQPPRDVSELYHELLYAVTRKFHGESRHETALRYIRDTEERAGQAGSCKQNVPLPRGEEAMHAS